MIFTRICLRVAWLLAIFICIVSMFSCKQKSFRPNEKAQELVDWTSSSITVDTLAVLQNNPGRGYVVGDIVRIRKRILSIVKGDIVFVKTREVIPGAWGPSHFAGEIIGLPGDSFTHYELVFSKDPNGSSRYFQGPSLAKIGIEKGEDTTSMKILNFRLSEHTYLLETNTDVYVVERPVIKAVVVSKVRHDDALQKEIEGTIY